MINEEFVYATMHTNNKIGNVAYDDNATEIVRRTMLVYIDRLFGILHDDYNYKAVNKYLTLVHKVFLKKSVCFPERMTQSDYHRTREYEVSSFLLFVFNFSNVKICWSNTQIIFEIQILQ